MVEEVRDLLRSYNAHATFFVCSDYTTPDLALLLLHDGHELANHLKQDSSSGYYCHLAKEDFRKELLTANQIILLNLKEQQQGKVHQRPPRWFRAPQGRMTQAMAEVVQEEKMMHVLGDCYCDDWAFAEDGDIQYVAPLMLQQVQEGGSIAIFHMPERGFREASLEALREFLEGTNKMNLRCISLTEMAASAEKVEDER
jgi:peptidoglycan/xylan/chitin deacetylase (PgdA/CDA1 family)